MRKVTINDIAKYTGVTPATVSYVINGKFSKVSAGTIERVKAAMQELNYVPNISARTLVNNESKLIGFFVPYNENRQDGLLANPFYSQIISGIESICRARGFHLIISGIDKKEDYSDIPTKRNLDGLVLLGVLEKKLLDELEKLHIPIILIDSYIKGEGMCTIGIDDEEGGYMATSHLIENRHKRIAIVNGKIFENGVTERRFKGYQKAMMQHGLYDEKLIFEDSVSFEFGYLAGSTIIEKRPDITAVFATADIIAFGIVKAVYDHAKAIPEDLSIVGFDDVIFSSMMQSPLTTIRQDIYAKGIRSAEMLIDGIEGKKNDCGENVVLPITLIERKSVRRL
jgi:DNA-binding LacI/PurR family transcriptional regulator